MKIKEKPLGPPLELEVPLRPPPALPEKVCLGSEAFVLCVLFKIALTRWLIVNLLHLIATLLLRGLHFYNLEAGTCMGECLDFEMFKGTYLLGQFLDKFLMSRMVKCHQCDGN